MDLWILTVGIGTFGLLMGGLFFTIREFRQMRPDDADGMRRR
jgi:hypothetical protein